jgi:hypothetical protein
MSIVKLIFGNMALDVIQSCEIEWAGAGCWMLDSCWLLGAGKIKTYFIPFYFVLAWNLLLLYFFKK